MNKIKLFLSMMFLFFTADLYSMELSQNYLSYLQENKALLQLHIKQRIRYLVENTYCPTEIWATCFEISLKQDQRLITLKINLLRVKKFESFLIDQGNWIKKQHIGLFTETVKIYDDKLQEIRKNLDIESNFNNLLFTDHMITFINTYFAQNALNFPIFLEEFFSEQFVAFCEYIKIISDNLQEVRL